MWPHERTFHRISSLEEVLFAAFAGSGGSGRSVRFAAAEVIFSRGPVASSTIAPAVKVHLLFFAVLRDIVGSPRLDISVQEGTTARQVWETLRRSHDELRPYAAPPMTAINEEYAPLDTPLHDGDEVAFIPPVSGG